MNRSDLARVLVAKAAPAQRYLLGVAYPAGPRPCIRKGEDGGRDFIAPDTLEKAAWNFVAKGAKVGLQHIDGTEAAGHATVVESYVYRGPDWQVTDTAGNVQVVKAGDWLVGMVLSPAAWQLHLRGLIDGFSPQGTARARRSSTERTADG